MVTNFFRSKTNWCDIICFCTVHIITDLIATKFVVKRKTALNDSIGDKYVNECGKDHIAKTYTVFARVPHAPI
jgi:hypothetical protein